MEMAPTYRCSKCDSFKPLEDFPPSKATNKGQWCRECLRVDARRHKALTATERQATCDACGATFHTTYTKAAFCSRQCKENKRNAATAAALLASKPARACVWCGADMPQSMRSDAKFCSAQCNMEAHRRTRNFRRRAGADAPLKPRKQPLINLAGIAKRDGYRCGICGKPVDMKLKHPDPGFPTLDHVLPLSAGGDPLDASNLRLAHLRCNVSLRDQGTSQLRLM
jgi:hypothetical protein